MNFFQVRLTNSINSHDPNFPPKQRYLATGDDYLSLSMLFRIAPNTISIIVKDTCRAIVEIIGAEQIQRPGSEEGWKSIANGFGSIWHLPHCTGAVDGKHISIRKPKLSGSRFFNYKKFFSIVLMAVVDANYRFVYVDIGREGSLGDAAVWNHCSLKDELDHDLLNYPTSKLNGLPYCFVGDEAFALQENFMKPFPKRASLTHKQQVFNYRISRARRVVENAFGQLVHRFRVFSRPLQLDVETAKLVVGAACSLHNFLANENPKSFEQCADRENLLTGEVTGGMWRNEVPGDGDEESFSELDDVSASKRAQVTRENFVNYFYDLGAQRFQWKKVPV